MVFKFLNIKTLSEYEKGVQRVIELPVQERITAWVDKFNSLNSVATTSIKDFEDFYDKLGNETLSDYFKSIQSQGVNAKASMEGVYNVLIGETKGYKNAKAVIQGYNKIVDASGKTQKNYANAVAQSNSGLGKYLQNVKSGEASMTGYIGKLVSAKIATLALDAATLALNVGIGFLISAIVQGIESLANSVENEKERLEDLADDYEKAQSEVEAVSQKIKENKKLIDEINSNPLSITTPDTLEKLEAENKQLEAQYEWLKNIADIKKRDLYKETEDFLTSTNQESGVNKTSIITEIGVESAKYFNAGNYAQAWITATNGWAQSLVNGGVNRAVSYLEQAQEYIDELNRLKDEQLKLDLSTDEGNKRYDEIKNLISEYETKLVENNDFLSSKLDSIDPDGEVYKIIQNIIEQANNWFAGKNVTLSNTVATTTESAVNQLVALNSATSELKETYDDLLKKQDKFQSALDKVQKGTSLTSDEILGLIEIYPQLASQFTKTADGWTIGSENIISANEQVVKSVKETVQEQIDGYQEIIDKYNNNKDSLKDKIAQFKTGDSLMGMPSDVRSQFESTASDELKQLADDAKEAQKQMDYLNLILQMLGVTTSEETKTLADYSKELSSTKSIVEDFKDTLENGGTLTTSDLQKALEKYPQLEDSLNQYLAGLKSQEQIYEELKGYYDQDLENFRTYLANKAVDDENTWTKFVDNNSSWVQALADSYALDLANLTTYKQMSDAIKNSITNNIPDTSAAYQTWLIEQGKLFERFKGVFGNVDDLIDTGSKSSSSSSTSSSSLPDGYTKAKKELEHIYNMGEISTRDYYLRLNQLAEQWLKGNEKYLDEYRSVQESVYSGLKSLYSDEINKQIEGYENVLDVLKNINQEKIDSLNKEKELLQDNADEEQRILDLKQAQLDLENAKKKTTWVITEQGLKQVQDESAVKEAQTALDKLELESKTAQIDKQVKALENENDSYDKIKTDWQNKINLENAKQFIGSDNIQSAVTNGFKEGYRNVLNEKENLDNLDKNGFNKNDSNYSYNVLLKKLGSNLTFEQVADVFKKSDFTTNFTNSYADKIKATTEKIVNNTSTTSNNSSIGDINIVINDAADPEKVGEVVVEKIKRIANLWNNKPKNAAFI